MEEIEKLRLRVEKDPNSRLFLPLAEEYRKSGLLDEAITVILRGLEYQPGYTSARVALGRLYLEKSMVEEARNEFENVVKSIPDNLFSHKKLAEIYKAGGQTEMAVREYTKVLELNPLDDDARTSLDEIEGKHVEIEEIFAESPPVESEAEPMKDTSNFSNVEAALGGEVYFADEEPSAEVQEVQADDAFDEFRASFSGASEEQPGEAEDFFQRPEDEVGIEDIFGAQTGDGKGDSSEEVLEEQVEEADLIEIPDEADKGSFEDVFDIDSAAAAPNDIREPDQAAKISFAGNGEDISKADSFVSAGNYYAAMEIYRKALSGDPENKRILQRVTELKALLKLLGKSDELLIARLDELLGAVRKHFGRAR